jgi:hypothetical protein
MGNESGMKQPIPCSISWESGSSCALLEAFDGRAAPVVLAFRELQGKYTNMKTIALFASIIIASGLLFANVYTSLVDARSWGSEIPGSIAAAREYFKTVSPANFFRIFSPLNQVLALAALVLFWKSSSSIRMCLAAALVLYVLTDVITFGYFYPRNEIMFRAAQLSDVALLRNTWASWSAMNWVRSSILLAGVILSCVSLHKIYSINH